MRSLLRYLTWLVVDHGWIQWAWLVLVFIGVGVLTVCTKTISLFYYLWPFPDQLDTLFKNTRFLQRLFSFRLQGPRKPDFRSIAEGEGYHVYSHSVDTEDGYVLTCFRLSKAPLHAQGSDVPAASGAARPGPPVLLMHGLMMCCDVWVVGGAKALPFALCDAGYDVWLGNNRGNRYSCKHRRLHPKDEQFWDFSLDEFARFDVPALVEFVCNSTDSAQLTYVGFSQGSAQGFASLSLLPTIARRVRLLVALSPAVTVKGLSSPIASSIIQASPSFIFLLFGHRAMLASAPVWQAILSEHMLARVMDRCLWLLFDWNTNEIDKSLKSRMYKHLYSPTSVKSVVHWFQMITRAHGKPATLQLFDDTLRIRSRHRANFAVAEYDIGNCDVPCALFYGEADTIIDGPALVKRLGARAVHVHVEPTYEHLDFLWSTEIARINAQVVKVLGQHCA